MKDIYDKELAILYLNKNKTENNNKEI